MKKIFRQKQQTDNVHSGHSVAGGISLTIIILAILILCMNSFYNVGEQEQAVITMFGQVQGVKSAGLYAKIPFIQKVHKVDTTTHGMPIGYTVDKDANKDSEESASTTTVANESTMITSDFNFVNIDLKGNEAELNILLESMYKMLEGIAEDYSDRVKLIEKEES